MGAQITQLSLSQQRRINDLQETVRKKSDFELEYDSHKKKLMEREQELEERERSFHQKSKKASSSRRQNNSISSAPSKRDKNKTRSTRDQNKFKGSIREMPFHWLSLFSFVQALTSFTLHIAL